MGLMKGDTTSLDYIAHMSSILFGDTMVHPSGQMGKSADPATLFAATIRAACLAKAP